MNRRDRAFILIALLAMVQLTAISVVPHAGATPTLVCPSGTSLDTGSGLCRSASTCPSGFSIVGGDCESGKTVCPSGYFYNASVSTACNMCPAGTTFSPAIDDQCSSPKPPSCPSGTTLSGSKCSDGSVPTCPAGTHFDSYYKVCDAYLTNVEICTFGLYDVTAQTCRLSPTCPTGSTITSSGDFCVAAPAEYCASATPTDLLGVCLAIGHPDLATRTTGLPAGPATIGDPTGLAFDSSGDLWVVDSSNSRVLEYAPPFSTGEAATLVIGQTSFTGTGDSSPAGALYYPMALTFDAKGNLWVTDWGNNRVLEFKAPFSTGELASLVLGQSTFGGYVGATTAKGMNSPSFLAFDPEGNLWVTDAGNNRVLAFAAPFSTGQAASLVLGQPDFTSSSPGTTAKGLFEPLGIGFDVGGNLWVVDSANHRILGYNAPTFSTDEAASYVIGQPDFTSGGVASNGLAGAVSIAFDSSSNLWVSDGISGVEKCLYPFPTTGEAITRELGQKVLGGNASVVDTRLSDPQGIAIDSGNNLWVADSDHGRVLQYGNASVPPITSTSTTSSSTSSTSGGAPEFPYQLAIATVFTVLLAASYLLTRRHTTTKGAARLQ